MAKVEQYEFLPTLCRDDYRKLVAMAARNGMSLNELVSDLLERSIEQYEKANGKIFLADCSATPR